MSYANLKKSIDPKIRCKKEVFDGRVTYNFYLDLPPHPDFQNLPTRFSQLYTKSRYSEAGIAITVSEAERYGGGSGGVPRYMTPRQWQDFTIDPASPALLTRAVYRRADDVTLQMSMDFVNWLSQPCRDMSFRTNGEWLDSARRQKAEVAAQPSLADVDAYIAATFGKDASAIGRNTRSKLRNAARKAMANA